MTRKARVIVNAHREQARSYRLLTALVQLAHQLRLSLGQAAGLGQFVDAGTHADQALGLGITDVFDQVVLASGDPLFYGIGTRLIAHFGRDNVQVIPGVSAVQYLCARAGIDMNDMWLTSSHGRDVCFDELARQRKVAMVTDGRCGPREIAAQLAARGKGYRWMVIGENLAMDNERIRWLPVSEVDGEYEMNAVVILDER